MTAQTPTTRRAKAAMRKSARPTRQRPSSATRPAKPSTKPRPGKAASTPKSKPATGARPGTKQAALIAMLERPQGATIEEIVAKTGWQPHTVRGAISGALKKRLQLTVVSEKIEGRGRAYRIKR